MTVPLSYYVALSAVVFLTGLLGVLVRRNVIIILLSVELMLNATNINFVAFSQAFHNIAGQVFVFFALTVAAAEVAVGTRLCGHRVPQCSEPGDESRNAGGQRGGR